MTEWYYLEGDEQQERGPVTDDQLRGRLRAGDVTAQTYVWRPGMIDWQPVAIAAPSLAPSLQQQVIVEPPQSRTISEYTPEQFRELYRRWIGMMIGCIGTGVVAVMLPRNSPTAGALMLASAMMLTSVIVMQMVQLYRFWRIIQDGRPRTTPGKAVGFLFIPIFYFYWIFQAYYGLAQDTGRYLRERRIRAAAPKPRLAMTLCVLTFLGVIPQLTALIALVHLLIGLVLFREFKEAAAAIARWKQRG